MSEESTDKNRININPSPPPVSPAGPEEYLEQGSFFYRYRFFLPDSLTMANALCGVLGGYFATLGYIGVASFFIVLGFIFDAFDGPTARYLKCSGELGMYLDSLADVTTFGVAAAQTLFSYFSKQPLIGFSLGAFHFICVCTRLAVFMTEEGPPGLFRGMPCPFAGVFAAAICAAELPNKYIIILSIINSIYMITWDTIYIKPFSVKSKKALSFVWFLHLYALFFVSTFSRLGNIMVALVPFLYGTIPTILRFYYWLFKHSKFPSEYDYCMTVGVYDMFHKGHLELFAHMSVMGRKLLVGVHDDQSVLDLKKIRTTDPLDVRMNNASKQRRVHKVFPVHSTDPSEVMNQMIDYVPKGKSVCYMRGDDWINFPGRPVLEQREIPIIFHHYTENISSSLLRLARNKHTI